MVSNEVQTAISISFSKEILHGTVEACLKIDKSMSNTVVNQGVWTMNAIVTVQCAIKPRKVFIIEDKIVISVPTIQYQKVCQWCF